MSEHIELSESEMRALKQMVMDWMDMRFELLRFDADVLAVLDKLGLTDSPTARNHIPHDDENEAFFT